MRDHLVKTQAKQNAGHKAGSWTFDGHHSSQGGRLYNTALAAMTLEIYYRYMPIYAAKSVEENLDDPIDDDFKVDGEEKEEKKDDAKSEE